MTKAFQDLFSTQSKTYAQFRPTYPEVLFEYLSGLTSTHDTAWDCGTGNGQAAVSLAKVFKKVWATDPSEAQIRNAIQCAGVEYLVGAELQARIPTASVDLVTVAQALHWFKFDEFYKEVRRVCKSNAVIAAWAYDFNEFIQLDINDILRELYFDTLGSYWAKNNKLIWDGYKDIPFPFKRLESPKFEIVAELNLFEFMGYLSSWSSSAKYLEANGFSAMEAVFSRVQPHWGDPTTKKTLKWKLHTLVGRVFG